MLAVIRKMKSLLKKFSSAKATPQRGQRRLSRKYAIVTAVYNTGAYLDDYFSSLTQQGVDVNASFEVICVDDGSTDNSAQIIADWQKRYPDAIKYIRKENGGPASSRNVGIKHATCEWVTFIDSDDFISANYFTKIDDFICKKHNENIGLVVAKHILYFEKEKTYKDGHPLRCLFGDSERMVPVSDPGKFIVCTGSNSFYLTRILKEKSIRQKQDIVPNFEDAEMNMQYLFEIQDMFIGIVPQASYYIRKRSDASSLMNSARSKAEYYSSVIQKGCIEPLRMFKGRLGSVPKFAQRMVLLELSAKIAGIVNKKPNLDAMRPGLARECMELLSEAFSYIDIDTIEQFERMSPAHKCGVLNKFKAAARSMEYVDVVKYDREKSMVLLGYYSSSPTPDVELFVDLKKCTPAFKKAVSLPLLGESFLFYHRMWLRRPPYGMELRAGDIHANRIVSVKLGTAVADFISFKRIAGYFLKQKKPRMGRGAAFLRRVAFLPYFIRKYKDAWIFIDTDIMADDNAAHLYRYVTQHHPELNCYFILRSSSSDWPARKREGFKLINYESWLRYFAMAHCKVLICSHTDGYLVNLPRSWKDLQKYKYIYVQHGVFKNDMSSWINNVGFDLITVTTNDEYKSMTDDYTCYNTTTKEVVLSGLPRHDALMTDNTPERAVLLMPTWRNYLTGARVPNTHKRLFNPEFLTSDYRYAWKSILQSDRLRTLSEKYGYKVLFLPHINMQLYLEYFEAPPYIEQYTQETMDSIELLFKRPRIAVTDYSSAAFEWALMRKSIIYYQFDHERFLNLGNAGSVQGYYEYERDGFGPVAYSEERFLSHLEEALKRDGAPGGLYQKRIEHTFPYNDTKSCKRVFEAVDELFHA